MVLRNNADSKATWLSPFTVLNICLMVKVPFFATSTEVKRFVSLQTDSPKLVSTSHRTYKCFLVDRYNIPRRRQFLCFCRFISFFVRTFLSRTDHSLHLIGCQIDLPNRMVSSVTNEQKMSALTIQMAQTLRMVKWSLSVATIDQANLPITYGVDTLHSLLVHKDKSIITAIRYYNHIIGHVLLFLDAEHSARVLQVLGLCILNFLSYFFWNGLRFQFLWLDSKGFAMIQTVVVEIVSRLNKEVHYLSHAFTLKNQDGNLGLWRYEHLTGPRPPFEVSPYDHSIIIYDRMLNLIFQHSVPYFITASFIQKLGWVAAQKHYWRLLNELLL